MKRALFSFYVWMYYCVLFAAFFFPILIAYIITWPFDRYRKIPNRILGMMAWCMIRATPGWKMDIQGIEKYDPSQPTVFIGNHESFLDIPLTFQLPWKMKWVVKRSMAFIPVMGWMVGLTGQLTIDRKSKSALKRLSNLVEPIKNLVPVMIFPEGTRSLDGKIKAFKNGAFLLAMEHGFKIQPLAIEGAYQALASGSKLFSTNAELKLRVLDAVDPKEFENMNALKEYCRNIIIDEVNRLKGI